MGLGIGIFLGLNNLLSKIITNHLKLIYNEIISEEQYGFLNGHQIHDVVSLTHESLHSMKTKKIPSFVMKLDLSKAYDNVNRTFFHLSLIQMRVNLNIINWIMGYIESSSFTVMIINSPYELFWS
jgi:hypothetical protein